MNIKEFVKQIEDSETNDCDVCNQYIWNLNRAVLLTPVEQYIFDVSDDHTSKEPLLVCDDCFRELIARFKITHGIDRFYKSIMLDDKTLNLR